MKSHKWASSFYPDISYKNVDDVEYRRDVNKDSQIGLFP